MILGAKSVAVLLMGLLITGGLGFGALVSEQESSATDMPALADLQPCEVEKECDLVAIGVMVRWGYLGPRESEEDESFEELPEEPSDQMAWMDEPLYDLEIEEEARHEWERFRMVPWDGFIQVTRGGVKLERTLLFESGGEYRFGGDDFIYPRNNRFTLEWRSSTTTHWDGVLVTLFVPRIEEPIVHVTIHTDQWSHIFEAPELVGLHMRERTDDLGHEIEINGFLVERHRELGDVARIGLRVRWGYLDDAIERERDEWDREDAERFLMVPWDGFISTTKGGVKLVETLLFESGGEYRFGGDDLIYPRNNRFTLEWRSSTTTHWDGIIVLLFIPVRAVPEAHVTIHMEQWSHIFEAHQLIGLNARIPMDSLGHEIEINGRFVGGCGRGLVIGVEMEESEDGSRPVVHLVVMMNDEPLEGAEVYVDDAFVGVSNERGVVVLKDVETGEHLAYASFEDLGAAIHFEL